MHRPGLHHKLIKAFILQIVLISAATVMGVYASAQVVEHLLVKYALAGEAKHYWQLAEQHSEYPLPNTMNLVGYLAQSEDYSAVPKELQQLTPGYYRIKLQGSRPIVYVEEQQNARLYLVFDEEQVAELSILFGIVPLSLVLILIYFFAWLAYRQSSKAISPLVKLADIVNNIDLREQYKVVIDLNELQHQADHETATLIAALQHFTTRLEQFIERERNFTRDASHELRTPLAVIKTSLAILQKRSDYQDTEIKALRLIETTFNDMQSLIDTLLLLAREESSPLPEESLLINDLLATVIEETSRSVDNQRIGLEIIEHCLLSITASDRVLTILFGNLLRNAFLYTQEGKIVVTIDEKSVCIADNGPGIAADNLKNLFKPFYRLQKDTQGHGLGLTIVKRLCNRFDWSLKIRSKSGEGTSITVVFPDARKVGGKNKAKPNY